MSAIIVLVSYCVQLISHVTMYYILFFKGPHCLVIIIFIGYNFKYGSEFVRNYSCGNISVVNLIREISDNSLWFDQNMLNMIVCTVSCE